MMGVVRRVVLFFLLNRGCVCLNPSVSAACIVVVCVCIYVLIFERCTESSDGNYLSKKYISRRLVLIFGAL